MPTIKKPSKSMAFQNEKSNDLEQAKKAYIKIAELNEKIDKVRNNREYDALMKQRDKYKKIVFNFEKGN